MIGLKINFRNTVTVVGVNDGLLVFNAACTPDGQMLYAGVQDSESKLKKVWYDNVPFEDEDEVVIEVVETDTVSEPVECIGYEPERPAMTRLEQFRQMKIYLKEKGLI